MKAKAITEGRRDIILYLVKRNDKWASPGKVFKSADARLGYGGTLKALKEMSEDGIIEKFDLAEGDEKPAYKFRCRQDLSGFKKLTKVVIDSHDEAFFLKYTSFPYFDKWCNQLIDDLVDKSPEIDFVWVEKLQETVQVSRSLSSLLLEFHTNFFGLTPYEKIEEHFREDYPEIKDTSLLKIVVGCVLQDYILGSEETKRRIENICSSELTLTP